MEILAIALSVLAISLSVYSMACQKQKIQILERKIEDYESSMPANKWIEPLKARFGPSLSGPIQAAIPSGYSM